MANSTIANAYVQIIPSMRGVKSTLESQFDKDAVPAGDSAGKKLGGRLGKALKIGFGASAAALGLVIKKAIGEGAAMEQAIGGIETLYKSSSDKMKNYAKQAYKTAGVSSTAYMENVTSFSAGLISSLNGNTKKAADVANIAMVDMSDNANKMGSNIADIQNAYQGFAKQNYTMLDNLKLGYGGTKGEMQRLLADATKLTGVKYDINNLSDVYQAIHAIQGKLDITGTTAKEASSTISGSFNSMKAAASDFLGNLALGNNIKGPLTNLVTTTGTFLFGNLLPAIGNVFRALPSVLATIFNEVGPKIGSSLINGLKTAGSAIATALPNMLSKGLNGLNGLLDKIGKFVPKMISAGFKFLQGLVKGIVKGIPILIKKGPVLVSKFADIINNNAPKLFIGGIKLIGQLVIGIIKAIPTLIANLPKIFVAIVKTFMAFSWIKLGKTIVKGCINGLKGLGSKIASPFRSAWSAVKSIVSKMGSGIKSKFNGIKSAITNIFKKIKSIIPNAFSSAKAKAFSIVLNMAGGIKGKFNALCSITSKVWTKIKSAITSPITAAKDKVKGIIDKIKSFFPLRIGKLLSGISLPHFSIKKSKKSFGPLGTISYPSGINVSWNAEGAIFTRPAILQGVGEAGPEAVLPIEKLSGIMKRAYPMNEIGNNSGDTYNIYMTVNGAQSPEEWARDFARELKRRTRMRG